MKSKASADSILRIRKYCKPYVGNDLPLWPELKIKTHKACFELKTCLLCFKYMVAKEYKYKAKHIEDKTLPKYAHVIREEALKW